MRDKVQKALTEKHGEGCTLKSIKDNTATYEKDGEEYEADFTQEGNNIKLGTGKKKMKTEIKSAVIECNILSAIGLDSAKTWAVRFMSFGIDKNGYTWSENSIKENIVILKDARIFLLNDSQHKDNDAKYGKSVREQVGWVKSYEIKLDGLYGTVQLLASEIKLQQDIKDSLANGKELFQLSIDAKGLIDDKKNVKQLISADFDIVYRAAAGGTFIQPIQSAQQQPSGDFNQMTMTNEELKSLIGETVKSSLAPIENELKQKTIELNELKTQQVISLKQSEITNSGLPEHAKTRLTALVANLTEEQLKQAITDEKEYIAKLQGGVVNGEGFNVQVLTGGYDNAVDILADIFENKKDCKRLRQAYIDISGDKNLTGQSTGQSIKSAITSASWSNVSADALNKQLVKEYNVLSFLDDWRKVVDIANLSDLKSQKRIRYGGYGNLPTVLEGNA